MKLNMSINEIHEALAIDCNSVWCNNRTTNCYAYSLGLDIPEDDIICNAYQVGTIGGHVFKIETCLLSFEEKLDLDLKVLNIQYEECDYLEKSKYFLDNNNLINIEWIIALYKDHNDYHFLRKSCDNSW